MMIPQNSIMTGKYYFVQMPIQLTENKNRTQKPHAQLRWTYYPVMPYFCQKTILTRKKTPVKN